MIVFFLVQDFFLEIPSDILAGYLKNSFFGMSCLTKLVHFLSLSVD